MLHCRGALGGLGSALVYRSEASTGGVDILGFLTRKYYHISVSTTNFLFDTCVMAAAVVFLGLTPVLYSMVLFFITLKATNLFMVGFDYRSRCSSSPPTPKRSADGSWTR